MNEGKMENKEKLFRVGLALNELYKNGESIVLVGDIFHTTTDTLSQLDIDYKFENINDDYNRIYL